MTIFSCVMFESLEAQLRPQGRIPPPCATPYGRVYEASPTRAVYHIFVVSTSRVSGQDHAQMCPGVGWAVEGCDLLACFQVIFCPFLAVLWSVLTILVLFLIDFRTSNSSLRLASSVGVATRHVFCLPGLPKLQKLQKQRLWVLFRGRVRVICTGDERPAMAYALSLADGRRPQLKSMPTPATSHTPVVSTAGGSLATGFLWVASTRYSARRAQAAGLKRT